ncbi:hypothetical protein [uncultured Fibrobacter sp.]|uniref:tetratricopeptide repeat protein n=1 Tax=uncultured Fibrobacter sp. TaxID=261512 RepID=UPI0025DE7DC6|nr:hypothetical protein [uncultured Fibrobacter sp.]
MATALLDSLKKSIGKKKSNSQAFAWLADLERESGDLDTALARVDGGLTLYPSDVPAMLVRSVILFEKGDFDGCITECERVLKYDPFCLSAQKRMGDAYEQLGNENERNKCYRRVHDMDPLDTFWKEEYDHVEEVAVVAATATALTNDDFSMPEDMTMDATPDAAETAVAEAAATATESIDAPVENSEAAADEEDPFAAFASIAATQDSGEEAAMDSLQSSLDSAMQDFLNDEPSMPEEFPEDEKVSGSDVSSAFNDMFGEDDDLEPEAPASPFAKLDLPTSLDEEPAAADTTAQNVFGNEVEEDKPQSVDSAFNDIFGEDELPEEKPQTAAPVEEDKPQSVDSAFNDIFGEDELPEEKPQSSSSLFEKSADSLELPSDDFELPAADAAPAVTGNADSLFEKSSESSLFEKSADEFELPAEDTPAVTGNADSLFEKSSESSLFEKSADDFELPAETATEELAPAEPPAAEPAVEPVAEQPAAADDQPFSVDSAFDSLFGEDDLPEENPQNTAAPAVEPAPSETLAEQVTHAEEELSIPATENADTTADDFAKEMGGAFTNIFGDTADDLDLPEAKPAGSFAPSEEDTGAAIEEAPLQNSSIEADIDKSFSRLFGEDDLPEEGENKTQAAPAAEPALDAAAEAPSAVETESLEKAVDGAFKGLFETDDDTPPEEHVAGNKGVDFLMSGDSDDEVSSGLIKDPSAPLSRGTAELDESLNTRTLAEIYYEQGLVDKALDIYEDLARKEPQNTEILNRLMEIEKAYREKFGGEANG